jgi:chitin synthase
LYDLTDYVNTISVNAGASQFQFLDTSVSNVFRQRVGQDVTKPLLQALGGLDPAKRAQSVNCLKNVFYAGETDFRKTSRCQVQNYMLLIASGILMSSMGLKCACLCFFCFFFSFFVADLNLLLVLAALQLGSKRNPENQDKFVLCQVPCYTEGEDSLRRTVDSLAGLDYDDKRKLIFIICDGNIIGSGNDRTTPRIVLDILGVDPKLDPEPLMFKSVGEGSRAINYGKIYSGLYEFEGHVVP